MDLLRFITAGSVDDGKSTLIGRLLYDSKAVSLDILETLQRQSKNVEEGGLDLALLTDGLRAEREQGITIDVAYKYFTTDKRKFIIADAPGHVQYTRNLVTGASNSDLAIILIDARLGLQEQTYRHTYIAGLLKIPQLVIAVNKMDLVDYSEELFGRIESKYKLFAEKLGIKALQFIPISARDGDNVVEASSKMPWYRGPSLLSFLENVEIKISEKETQGQFPVQYVIRPQTDELHDYRGYAGRVSGGSFKPGDEIKVLPSELTSTIEAIDSYESTLEEAKSGQSVVIRLKDDIDISRGDLLLRSGSDTSLSSYFESELCWMDTKKLEPGAKYLLMQGSRTVKAIVKEVLFKINVNTAEKLEGDEEVQLNDIAHVLIKTAEPLAFNPYEQSRTGGSAILIDERSNNTVAALMLIKSAE